MATWTAFWTISRTFYSSTPPYTRRVTLSTWYPCLESDAVTKLWLQVRDWERADAENTQLEEASIGLDPQLGTRARLLELQRLAYTDVAEPLEPYVLVIMLFAIPQVIGISEYGNFDIVWLHVSASASSMPPCAYRLV